MLHSLPAPPMVATTAIERAFEIEQDRLDTADAIAEARETLIDNIAAERLLRLQRELPADDVIGGIQSIDMAHAEAVRRALVLGDVQLATLVRAAIEKHFKQIAHEAAVASVEKDEAQARMDGCRHRTFRVTGDF